MPTASCPSCSTGFEVKPEWSGKRVRCPRCNQAFQVPTGEEEGDDKGGSATSRSVNRLMLGATLVIALTVGGAGGCIFGHRQGKSDDVRELKEAEAQAESAVQRQKTLESDLAAASADRSREKSQQETAMKERDKQLAAAVAAATQAKAQSKVAEEKLEAYLAKIEREAEDKKRAEAEKKKIPAIPITDERKRKSEADAEYVNRKLQSTNRSILKGMTMLFGFNSLCDDDNVTKESIARV